jgi:hypothetical protein
VTNKRTRKRETKKQLVLGFEGRVAKERTKH